MANHTTLQNEALSEMDGMFKALLYQKATALIEEVRKQEAVTLLGEELLNEADPKPRVEKDIEGKPVVPTEGQFQEYFDGMTAAHIEMMMATTHDRWKTAAEKADKNKEDKFAQAEVKSIETEISIGSKVLDQKKGTGVADLDQQQPTPDKTPGERMVSLLIHHLLNTQGE